MTIRHWFLLAASALVGFVAIGQPASGQTQLDQVYLAKGPPSRGTIPADAGMTRDKVTLEAGAVKREIEVNDIVRITFKEDPPELNAARNHVIQKNYSQALTDLKKIDGQRFDRAYVRQDVEYYKALCQCRLAMSEGGDKAAASDAMVAFVTRAPQSYHFYEAAEVLGDLAMASGKWADAVRYYGPLASARWPDYQLRANYAIGRALIGEKQYDQALDKFKSVIGSEQNTAESLRQKYLASVGRAVCLAETGKVDEAVTALQDLINKSDPQDAVLFARAYNALGRCYLKQNKPKEAVLAFLHTDVLFYSDADSHAEALYHLSKLWTDVNKSDRAVAARTTLRERYAGSIWAALE
jgi:tetratricopeptide (TPR) repeat protein